MPGPTTRSASTAALSERRTHVSRLVGYTVDAYNVLTLFLAHHVGYPPSTPLLMTSATDHRQFIHYCGYCCLYLVNPQGLWSASSVIMTVANARNQHLTWYTNVGQLVRPIYRIFIFRAEKAATSNRALIIDGSNLLHHLNIGILLLGKYLKYSNNFG
jgi:hypothetical protein